MSGGSRKDEQLRIRYHRDFDGMVSGALFWPQALEGRMAAERQDALLTEVIEVFLARYASR